MSDLIVIQGINPEPWAIGTINAWGKGKATMSPNPKVENYKLAIREDLERRISDFTPRIGWPVDLFIWYVRSTHGGGQPADVTNLNKATEDALQGILFGNDRFNFRVGGDILEQGPHVEYPGLIIKVEDYYIDPNVKQQLMNMLVTAEPVEFEGNDYEIPEDPFE